ncbi:Uncharacterised protein [Mycobacteroides abscessus subsp. abscessus]|nr:Uncharacterised protein [Mycobacteroides abscessus subsp. abscessus]
MRRRRRLSEQRTESLRPRRVNGIECLPRIAQCRRIEQSCSGIGGIDEGDRQCACHVDGIVEGCEVGIEEAIDGGEHQLGAERRALRREHRRQRRPWHTRVHGDGLTQHVEQLCRHLLRRGEAVVGIGRRRTLQELVERRVVAEHGGVVGIGETVDVPPVLHRHVDGQRSQGASDAVDVRDDLWSGLHDLRGLETRCAVEMSVAVDRRDGAEVDELHLVAADHDVVGFDVVVDQSDRMQIPDGGKHFEHVRDCLLDGQQMVGAVPVALITLAGDLLERPTADVLHHDVAEPLAEVGDVLDEVVDLDDAGVVHRSEELSLGQCDLLRLGVRRVEQALEDDGSVGDVAVDREVDPAESTVGDGPGDLVLARDERALRESRNERVARAAVGTLSGQFARTGSGRAADRTSAAPAIALALGDDRRIEHSILRLGIGDLGQFDQPRPESTVVHAWPSPRHESARLPDRDQRFVGIKGARGGDRAGRLVAHPHARCRLRRCEIGPLGPDVECCQVGTLGPDVEVG